MKCPKCGAYNKPEYKKCYVCNTLLLHEYTVERPEKPKKSMWTQSAFREDKELDITNVPEEYAGDSAAPKEGLVDANSMAEEAAPKEKKHYFAYAKKEQAKEQGIWGNEKSSRYTRRAGRLPVIALEDESDEVIKRRGKRSLKYAEKSLSNNAKRMRNFREGQEIGVVIPPEPEMPVEKESEKYPKKTTYKRKLNIKWGRLLLVSMLAVVVLFGAIVAISAFTNKLSESVSGLFADRNQLPNGGRPLVERMYKDGQTWHSITFFGEDGDKILVEDESHNLKKTLTVHNNRAVLSLNDYFYIPKDEEDEFYGDEFTYVDIEAWHFDSEGAETQLEVPVYRIGVPLAPLTVIHPAEQSMTFDTTQVLVKVKVEPDSRVIIDKKNMSGNIDADGYTSTYIFLGEEGINEIPILVEVDGYRSYHYTLVVNSPEKDVDIELTAPPTETQASELRIDGVTEPGAVVTLDKSLPLLISEIRVDQEGRFYIKTKLSDFGENIVILHVTAADGRTATLKHVIHRIPLEGAYTGSAWVLDYKALSSSANKMIGQVYHLEGYVTERIDTPKAKLFLFNAGTAAEPKYLIIEYNGLYDIIEGKIYDVYADVTGKFENYPRLYARFIYVSDDQNQNGINDKEENYVAGQTNTADD